MKERGEILYVEGKWSYEKTPPGEKWWREFFGWVVVVVVDEVKFFGLENCKEKVSPKMLT